MAQMLTVGMTNIVLPKIVPEFRSHLTPREKEVLHWAAEGKTT